MADATAAFFEGLPARSPEPLVGRVNGSLRVELTDGKRTERWLVTVARGDLAVSKRSGKADCIVRARKQEFDRIAGGRLNPLAAMLRGLLVVEGDPKLIIKLQRLFPSPPRTRP